MLPARDATDAHNLVLGKLRDARQDFHIVVTNSPALREQFFAPEHLTRTIRDRVTRSFSGSYSEQRARLLVLTALLYSALDWQFAGHGIDIETDVQIERMRQDQAHGGPEADDVLTTNDWRERLLEQLSQLERHLPPSELYPARLTKVTALAQAALEASYRRLAMHQVEAA